MLVSDDFGKALLSFGRVELDLHQSRLSRGHIFLPSQHSSRVKAVSRKCSRFCMPLAAQIFEQEQGHDHAECSHALQEASFEHHSTRLDLSAGQLDMRAILPL